MEIKGLNNQSNQNILAQKNISKLLEQNTVSTNNNNLLKNDSKSISQISQQKGIPTDLKKSPAPEKNALTSFGEKMVNQPILDHYLAFRKSPEMKKSVEAVDSVATNGGSIYDIEREAIKNSFSGNKNSKQALSNSYKSILASVIHNKYSDKNFFNGERDKVFHYFVSGSMTVEIANKIPLLPKSVKADIAGGIVWSIGWLKEAASIPGNGFGKDDMQANEAGINRAKYYIKSMK